MRLRTQFLISLIVFALVTTVIVSSVFVTSIKSTQLHNQRDIASEMETDAGTLDYISIDYFLYEQNLTDWQTMVSLLDVELASLNSQDPQQQALVDKVKFDLDLANDTFNSVALTLKSTPINGSSGGIPMFEGIWNRIAGQIQQLTYDMEQLSKWLDQEANSANQANIILIVTLIALFGAYFVVMYRLVFKRTLLSIANLRKKTKALCQGNLNYPTGNNKHDEIGELSADFDQMVGNLKQTTASKKELENEIAERKKAEHALLEAQAKLKDYASNLEKLVEERTRKIRESEQSYHELYDSFGEAFIATDWELNVIHWNKAAERVTAIKSQNALGKKVYEVLPEMMNVDVTPYYGALQNKKPTRFMMNTVSRETNKPSIFEISTYPSALGIIIIVEDKTEEEQTKRLSAIGQTAGMVGHDIRNPLQAITSDLYLIREELNEVPECRERTGVQESLSTIEENIFYINKIVSDLQDYTRPLAPVGREVNLSDLLYSTLKTTEIPKNVEAEVLAPKNLVIRTDGDFLMRAVSNLVINAVQAMPNGGKLSLAAAQKEAGKVVIKVRDAGMGIPKEMQGKIFTPLFTTKSKGQGLGLAVVKRLVDVLKGNISFVSEEGKGTEFTIELPQTQ